MQNDTSKQRSLEIIDLSFFCSLHRFPYRLSIPFTCITKGTGKEGWRGRNASHPSLLGE